LSNDDNRVNVSLLLVYLVGSQSTCVVLPIGTTHFSRGGRGQRHKGMGRLIQAELPGGSRKRSQVPGLWPGSMGTRDERDESQLDRPFTNIILGMSHDYYLSTPSIIW